MVLMANPISYNAIKKNKTLERFFSKFLPDKDEEKEEEEKD